MNLDTKQNLAIEKLSKLKAGALFMKMGTGKTKVAVELAVSRQDDYDYIIWIAPASLIREQSYKDEIAKWSYGMIRPIKFFTIEGVSSSDNKYMEMLNLASSNRVFCIIDESITIKNTEAGRTKRLLNIWNLFDFRLILNGTPLTKGLIDLYSQIQFIHPNILKMSETQFANNFLVYMKEGYRPWKRWSRPENEEALIEIIRPYIFDAELDIDCGIKYYNEYLKLTDGEQSGYQQYKELFLHGKFKVEFLAAAQSFQHFYTFSKNKKESLINLMESIFDRGEKVIIYVKFLDEIEKLKWIYNDAVIYTGVEKQDLKRFKGDSNILLCTYGVGSFGHNWQYANNIIYFSQTFDYKDKEHSLHRVYRTGQKKQVNIYNYWLDTGLDKLIHKSLSRKRNVLSNVERLISKKEALEL